MGCWESSLSGSAACKANALPAVLSLRSLIFFSFWVALGNAQGSLLALHSGITPGGAQGTIWDAGNRTGSTPCKANALPAVLLLQPLMLKSLIHFDLTFVHGVR